jgi:hypothetical protein
VNISNSWLADAAQVLNCKLSHIPFHNRHLSFWTTLIEKIHCKLSLWKSRHLSMGDRLILIKSVLSSIPVYFISFFKAPTCIISLIEYIFKSFFCEAGVRNLEKLIG